MIRNNLFLFVACIFFAQISFAQEKDSLKREEEDSLRFYKKIKKAANKYKLTRLLYEATFRDPEPQEYPEQPASKEEKQVNPYIKVQHAVIRNIKVTVYDPFGFSVNDTTPKKINLSQKAGNSLHITTRKFLIINRLLFKQNDTVQPLKISESERLLREAEFVNDARIYTVPTRSKDSVDLHVIVHDKWPLSAGGELTDQNANGQFRNRNLFGSGNQFYQEGKIVRDLTYLFRGNYTISNIDNTYMSSTLGYETSQDGTNVFVSLNKPFYSFLAKWAGGIHVGHNWRKYSYNDTIHEITRQSPLNFLNYDVWVGRQIKLGERKTLFNQSTNLILGSRFYRGIFLNRPNHVIDTAKSFVNESAFIGNVGFAVQQYYKDKFIYRFGANEDVPEGFMVQFIFGGKKREFDKVRAYNGVEVARAKHFDWGYLSGTFSYGIFYNTKVPNDITTNYKLLYFSELFRRGRWFFRQFLTFNLVHGENKFERQRITLRSDEMYGFQVGLLDGNTKMIVNSETVAYLPYKFIGFKFAPVVAVGLGMLGDKVNPLLTSRLFQGYSLGLMIRNENLLVSTFQLSVGVYPFLPDGKELSVVYNPVATFSLRVRGFNIDRPDFIAYY